MTAQAISYYDEKGQGRAYLSADAIGYTDENGRERAAMDARGVWYYDENGRARAAMDSKGMRYADETGTPRAQLGAVDTVDQATGKMSLYPAGVALFDEAGKKVWQAPQ